MNSRLALAAAVCYVLSLPMSAALILAWAFERTSLEFMAWFVAAGSAFAVFLWSLWEAGYRPWLLLFGYFITGCCGRGVFRRGLLVVGQRVLRVERPGRPFSPGLLLGHADRVYLLDDGRYVRVVLEARGLTCRVVMGRLEEAVEYAVRVMGRYGFEVSVEVPEKPVKLPARIEKLVKNSGRREERVYAPIPLSPRIVLPPALIIYDYAGAGLYRLASRGWAWGVDALRTEEVPGFLADNLVLAFWEGVRPGFAYRSGAEFGVLVGHDGEGRPVYMQPSSSGGDHALVAGMTGSGKSTLLAGIAVSLAEELGQTVVIVDWHGEFGFGSRLLVGRDYGVNLLSHFTVGELSELMAIMGGKEWEFTPIVTQVLYSARQDSKSVRDLYFRLAHMLGAERRQDYRAAIDAAMRRLEPLLHRAFNFDNFTLDFKGLTVLDLSLLDDVAKRLFAAVFLLLIYKYYSGRRRLYLILDEASNVSKLLPGRRSPLALLADQSRKYNIAFVVADQQPHLLEPSVQGMATHYFLFQPGGPGARRWAASVLKPYWTRDPRPDLESLKVGECIYLDRRFGRAVRVVVEPVKLYQMAQRRLEAWRLRAELEEERLRLIEEARILAAEELGAREIAEKSSGGDATVVDVEKVRRVALRHGVSQEALSEAVSKLSKEALEEAMREGEWRFLVEVGLARAARRGYRLKRLGKAVLEYYGIDLTE